MGRKYNSYRIVNETAILTLTQGKETIIDVEDLERVVAMCSWFARYNKKRKRWDVMGHTTTSTGKQKTIALYRVIMGITDPKIFVDHINHNTLDNRKSALRIVTRKQNGENRKGAQVNNLTGVLGVTINGNKYLARVISNGKPIVSKRFPRTDEGLTEATEWVRLQRLKFFTHSDGR